MYINTTTKQILYFCVIKTKKMFCFVFNFINNFLDNTRWRVLILWRVSLGGRKYRRLKVKVWIVWFQKLYFEVETNIDMCVILHSGNRKIIITIVNNETDASKVGIILYKESYSILIFAHFFELTHEDNTQKPIYCVTFLMYLFILLF